MSYRIAVAITCGLLFFIMGKFGLAEHLGVKRFLQFAFFILLAPYSLVALYKKPNTILNIYVLFLLVMFITEMLHNTFINKLILIIFSLSAVIAIATSKSSFLYTGKTIVKLAYYFSLLACLHFIILLLFPEVEKYGLIMMTEQGLERKDFHILSLLGFVTGEQHSFWGLNFTRIRSFASEPSLLLLFFYFPMCLSIVLSKKLFNKETVTIGVACLLSFSGSLYMAFVLSAAFFLIIKILVRKKQEKSLVSGFIIASILFIIFFSLNNDAVNIFNSPSEINSAFDKNRSFTTRSNGIANSLNIALASPLGATQGSNLPGPIVLNTVVSAGWIGAAFIIIIIYRILKATNFFIVNNNYNFASRFGGSLLLGGLFVVSTFSDYGMTGYAGIVILLILYKVLTAENKIKSM